ncbi:MAG: TIGR00296 family protein [Thaumarchaeota archaeon]|nr:TIGR00296 family protein [Candidatus Calditenuaceae archaeon]MDW8187567.1 TIGR00296 family protein [Nitrososphaerota archaeon]
MEEIGEQAAARLIAAARKAIAEVLAGIDLEDVEVPAVFGEEVRRGVFVTLYTYPEMELRGCIGYPRPVDTLEVLTVRAAIAAALYDPRFPQLKVEELDSTVLELSVLTPLELIRVDARSMIAEHVEVGRHGLVIEWKGFSGLLLPQVAVEQGWDAEEFLINVCLKAGLPPSTFLDPMSKIYRFEAELYIEERPNGPVKRLKLERPKSGCSV